MVLLMAPEMTKMPFVLGRGDPVGPTPTLLPTTVLAMVAGPWRRTPSKFPPTTLPTTVLFVVSPSLMAAVRMTAPKLLPAMRLALAVLPLAPPSICTPETLGMGPFMALLTPTMLPRTTLPLVPAPLRVTPKVLPETRLPVIVAPVAPRVTNTPP